MLIVKGSMHSVIRAIEYCLPEQTLPTGDLAKLFPNDPISTIDSKTGIRNRHIAGEEEYASDLAEQAGARLFTCGACRPDEIDFLFVCTQSADYAIPTTACMLQDRLGIPTSAGALDFNLGCSGFVYGLSLAEGLIKSEQAETILLITTDTYSKYLAKADKTTRALFGDAAAATLLRASSAPEALMGPFVFGTDGRGFDHLIVPGSGLRKSPPAIDSSRASAESNVWLRMNGQRIFEFVMRTVPEAVDSLLRRACLSLDDVDLVVFHQANKVILDELKRILKIPKEKLYMFLEIGNTVSSTIPIALKQASLDGVLNDGHIVLLMGFGVGYSWAGTLLKWYCGSSATSDSIDPVNSRADNHAH